MNPFALTPAEIRAHELAKEFNATQGGSACKYTVCEADFEGRSYTYARMEIGYDEWNHEPIYVRADGETLTAVVGRESHTIFTAPTMGELVELAFGQVMLLWGFEEPEGA